MFLLGEAVGNIVYCEWSQSVSVNDITKFELEQKLHTNCKPFVKSSLIVVHKRTWNYKADNSLSSLNFYMYLALIHPNINLVWKLRISNWNISSSSICEKLRLYCYFLFSWKSSIMLNFVKVQKLRNIRSTFFL